MRSVQLSFFQLDTQEPNIAMSAELPSKNYTKMRAPSSLTDMTSQLFLIPGSLKNTDGIHHRHQKIRISKGCPGIIFILCMKVLKTVFIRK